MASGKAGVNLRFMRTLITSGLLALGLGCASSPERLADSPTRAIRTYPNRIIPGGPLTAASHALAARTINSPSLSSAPTLAQPLTGAGSPALAEVHSASGVISPSAAGIPRPDELLRSAHIPAQTDILNTAAADLPSRVRQALTTGRPESITSLSPERLDRFEIDAAHGIVTLRGNVRSETERLMIGHRVAGMDGVRAVNNQLRVVSPTRHGMEDPSAPASRAGALQGED